MLRLVITMAVLALVAAPGASIAADARTGEELEAGDRGDVWELTLEPVTGSIDVGLMGGEICDYAVVGDRFIAVGSRVNRRGVDRGAAWATGDGGEWEQTHRLPQRAGLTHLVPLDDGVLAFGPPLDPKRERPIGTWPWGLGLDGSVSDGERIPSRYGGRQHPIDIAGHPDSGMVLLSGDQEWGRLEALYKAPGRPWQTVVLPRSATVDPLHVIETGGGFVVLGMKRRGLLAWRSEDGRVWTEREQLPDSSAPGDRGSTDLAYDPATDRLVVVAHPDRVWLSEAGGPFETVGPLPVSHAGSLEAYDGTHRAIVLDDGFLVVTTDEVVGTRAQTSTDGRTWVPGPRLRVKTDGSELGPQASARKPLRDADRLLLDGSEPGELVSAPMAVDSYRTQPPGDTQ